MKFTQEQIVDAFKKLPEQAKDFYMAQEITDSIQQIGKEVNLPENRMGDLTDIVNWTMLGLIPKIDLVNYISQTLQIDNQKSLAVEKGMDLSVFEKFDQIYPNRPETPIVTNFQKEQKEAVFAPVPLKKTIQNIIKTNQPSDKPKMIPDHETMEKLDGIHLHSQTVMPVSASSVRPSQPQPVRPSQPTPVQPAGPQQQTPASQQPVQKKPWSIVDQKLSSLVRSSDSLTSTPAAPANLPTDKAERSFEEIEKQRAAKYKGNDPYREPLQ